MIFARNRQLLPNHTGAAYYFDAMNMDGNGGLLANSSSVSSWYDLTGNGHTLTQSTGANQPVYLTQSCNNNNSISFSAASSQYLTGSNIAYAGELTIMALLLINSSTLVQRFLSYGASGGVSIGNPPTTGLTADFTINSVVDTNTSSNFYVLNQFVVITARLRNPSGSTWVVDFLKNGVDFQTNIAAAAPVSSSSPFTIGAFSSSAAFWSGKIAMLAGWHGLLNTAIENQMHLLFKTRGNLNP